MKVVKCMVGGVVVDISANQLGGLATVGFLEEVRRPRRHHPASLSGFNEPRVPNVDLRRRDQSRRSSCPVIVVLNCLSNAVCGHGDKGLVDHRLCPD